MPGHTLERLQTRTMPTGDLDSSFDDRSRDVATGEPQLGSPQIRAVSPMESIAELPVQAVLDSSASRYTLRSPGRHPMRFGRPPGGEKKYRLPDLSNLRRRCQR